MTDSAPIFKPQSATNLTGLLNVEIVQQSFVFLKFRFRRHRLALVRRAHFADEVALNRQVVLILLYFRAFAALNLVSHIVGIRVGPFLMERLYLSLVSIVLPYFLRV